MVLFFGTIKDSNNEKSFKLFFKQSLSDEEYVETLAKYFEDKLKKHKKNIELRYNLTDLITDLDFLKQYITKS